MSVIVKESGKIGALFGRWRGVGLSRPHGSIPLKGDLSPAGADSDGMVGMVADRTAVDVKVQLSRSPLIFPTHSGKHIQASDVSFVFSFLSAPSLAA